MTDARYVPREFCVPFYEFGISSSVKWRALTLTGEAGGDRVQMARQDASFIQHEIARQVRTRLKDVRSSVTAVAEACGMKPERLRRVLRGEVPMRLDDVTLLDLVLGELKIPPGAPLREQMRTRSTRDGDASDLQS